MPDTARPPIRVLIVDDEAAILDAYRHVFTAGGERADPVARRALGAKLFGGDEASVVSRPPSTTVVFEPEFCQIGRAHV